MSDISNPPSHDTTAPRKARRWWRYPVYFLALAGALLIGLIVFIAVREKAKPALITIDETATIDQVMTRAYGKYSEDKKGWLYVADGNRPFLVRVIQQARIETVGASDEFYFATAGTPLDGAGGAFYGVFQIRPDANDKAGGLSEISSPYRFDGDVAVKPENVHFEALAEHTWAWVLKVQDGTDAHENPVRLRNVVLAPHGDDIALLATFKAATDADPGIDCALANSRYASWQTEQTQAAAEAQAASAGTTPASDTNEDDGEEQEDVGPLRCEHSRWTYRTADVVGAVPGPLSVTSKGTLYGQPLESKTWKLMFDSKSFVYNVPAELAPE